MLTDGTYDAIVVDADQAGPGAVSLELVLLDGDNKGKVVRVVASRLGREPAAALGLPATIRVLSGNPSVTLED
jgi:hypothetical protein